MPRAFVSAGSNVDRVRHLGNAIDELNRQYGHLILSPVYESAAVGFAGDPFYNLVIAFDTDEEPEPLVQKLRALEQAHGRPPRHESWAARTLDLDLVRLGEIVSKHPVRLPRPECRSYAFILKPLADIAPHWRDPEAGVTYLDLWRQFDQDSQPLVRVQLPHGWPDRGGPLA
ncbi:MAG: 2-amino-4-hydroxy-6-hydroxymethyldihydropteridine diphosphokinase [Acidiferrobacteraceae bacterium]